MCRVVLPCFSFPVKLNSQFTHSTATNRHPQNVTADCGQLGTFSESQHWRSAGLTGLVCSKGEETQKGVSSLLCDVLSKNVFCVSTGIVYVRRFRCSCYVLQSHLPPITAADRHSPRLYILCVCHTTLSRHATLTTLTGTSYSCVRRENVSPHTSVLPASEEGLSHTNTGRCNHFQFVASGLFRNVRDICALLGCLHCVQC